MIDFRLQSPDLKNCLVFGDAGREIVSLINKKNPERNPAIISLALKFDVIYVTKHLCVLLNHCLQC